MDDMVSLFETNERKRFDEDRKKAYEALHWMNRRALNRRAQGMRSASQLFMVIN